METSAPPSAGFYNFLGWLEANKKRVAIIAAVAAIVGCVIGLLVWRSSEREKEAALALASVRMPLSPIEPVPPGTAEAFLKVAQDYPNTPAAPQAVFRAAMLYFSNGQFVQAQEQFNNFLAKYGDTPWTAQARYGIAACLDAQGKTQEAITKYNEFVRANPGDTAADDARLNLARLYDRANQPTAAIELLSKMTNAGPFTAVGAEVQDRMKALYTKYPDLAPKRAPAPVMRAPTSGGDVPLMLRNVPNTPQPTPAPGAAAPAPAPGSAPNAPANAPKIILPTPGQNNQPGN
ncbi:MAG TPA: tetratricopeptide repeat protein [Candidatus Acidoferrum sp.]|nr:tetratricopeptide repeat protein [Candidatus Acidoferrum sp.]